MIRIPCYRAPCLVAALGGLGLAAVGCDPTGIDPSSEVHGTALKTTIFPQPGSPPLVQTWEGSTIEAWVPGATGYQTFSGALDSAGQFRIANVPPGPYWLVFRDEVTTLSESAKVFVWTEARELDLGYKEWSPELQDETVPLGGIITGLSPAELDDYIQLAPASGSWYTTWGPRPLGTEQVAITPPAPLRVRPGVSVSAQQLRKSQQGSLTANTIVKHGEVVAVAGASSTPNIALRDPPARQLDLQVDHGEFLRQLGSTPPNGATVKMYLDFTLLAGPKVDEILGRSQTALRLSAAVQESQNPSLTAIRYGDPYPSDWARGYELRYGASYPCTAQDTGSGCGGNVYARGPLSELAAGTLRPRLSRPQGLAIDGKDAMTVGDEVGQSPTVRWQAPASGEVSTYLLSLIHLVPQKNNSPTEEPAGLFITSKNEVTVLPGVLQPGERYYFKLRALSGLDIDAAVAPVRASLRKTPAETTVRSQSFTVTASSGSGSRASSVQASGRRPGPGEGPCSRALSPRPDTGHDTFVSNRVSCGPWERPPICALLVRFTRRFSS